MMIKKIKVMYHPPYSRKIILPKDFCKFLGIDSDNYITIELDTKNKFMILKKESKYE